MLLPELRSKSYGPRPEMLCSRKRTRRWYRPTTKNAYFSAKNSGSLLPRISTHEWSTIQGSLRLVGILYTILIALSRALSTR
jgi:hypothetical protein